ncbi:MAG: sigma-70 family RNA polymerase sigma factor [Sedimentisphaerales bacterium]|nr:sigma-70 family RNA polymerase sigma factor [Sedimentisphaerales bacterium]
MKSGFELQIYPHLPNLRRAALGLTRNQMDANDLVQETLLRAFRFWHRFTPGTNCRAWLLRILNNHHINEWRVYSKRVISVDIDCLPEASLNRLSQFPLRGSSPEQDMISESLDDSLQSALYQLKDEYRKPLVLYFFKDLPYSQIALESDLSLGTVKSRLYRGKQLLRKNLNENAINNRYA